MTITKNSFILYTEYLELIEQLSDKQAGELFKGIFKYNLTGVVPDFDPITKLVFISIRQNLDRNAEKYEAKVQRLRENASKGRKSRKSKTEEKKQIDIENEQIEKNFFEKKQIESDNDNVNVNVNANVNENVNDNVLSLSNGEKKKFEREIKKTSDLEGKISKEEREILENYIKKKNLATKNVRAYANRLVENGDYIRLLEDIRKEKEAEEGARAKKIQAELDQITDKYSAAMTLGKSYYKFGKSPPSEFDEIIEKYDLGSYEKCADYVTEVNEAKKKEEEASYNTGRIKYINGTYVFVPNSEEK